MQPAATHRNLSRTGVIALVLALGVGGHAQARSLRVAIQELRTPVATGKDLRVSVATDAASAGAGRLQLDLAALDAVQLGYHFTGLHWECPLTVAAGGGWSCKGEVRARGSKPMQLALAFDAPRVSARLAAGASSAGVDWAGQASDPLRMHLQQVPVAWIQAFLARLWEQGRVHKGVLDGELTLRSQAQTTLDLDGRVRVRGLALDSADGGIATEGVDADAELVYRRQSGQQRMEIQAQLHGGQLLAAGMYAVLPATPVRASVRLERSGSGDWIIPSWRWVDEGVVTAGGSARWSAQAGWRALEASIDSRNLAIANPRYLTGWLDPAGLAGLRLAGSMQLQLALDASGWRSLRVRLQAVDAVDGKQRFALQGLDGKLHWTAGAGVDRSELRWARGSLFGIDLGATDVPLRSQDRHVALAAPVSIPTLGGSLRLDRFDYIPPAGAEGARFTFGLSLQHLQVAQLAKAFGWPAFAGTLDGSLPSAHYRDNRLDFDGALDARAFGGKLAVTRLALERPFGADPSLSADIDLDDLDLVSLTSVFGFGQISGRLDGRIRDLRLLDWTPIAFDAHFWSDDKAPERRRISQRAVADLSSVGGGIAANLQSRALKLFQDFGYARLGLSCRLVDNVCHMDGIGSAGSGYTIVEGSGLPRITVNGFERKVDWPTLVARLKAATQGRVVIK